MIDFSIGQPSHLYFNCDLLANIDFSDKSIRDCFYYTSKNGDEKLRHILIDLFGSRKSTIDNLIVTYGVLNGIGLILNSFSEKIKKVYMLNPTYKEAISLFENQNIKIKEIPVVEGRIDFEQLKKVVTFGDCGFYVIPNLNNPDGMSLNSLDKEMFAKLTIDSGNILIEDDIYHDFFFNKTKHSSIFETANHTSNSHYVFRLISLSKNLMPGLRIGFVEGSNVGIEVLLNNKFDFGTSPVLSHITYSLLKQKDLFNKNRATYIEYLTKNKNFLVERFGDATDFIKFNNPDGGYFLWGELPIRCCGDKLLNTAESMGVSFSPGSLFRLDHKSNYLRLCYGYLSFEMIEEGADILLLVLKQQFSGN